MQGQEPEALARRRGAQVLFVVVALGTTAFVASITVSPILGDELAHSTSLAGFPWASAILGTGIGSALLSQLMARRGRGIGLVIGYAVGGLGAVVAVAAGVWGSFALLIGALLLMGWANAASGLARYAAADLYPPEVRASGLSMVVWAGTIGGVAGPALLQPSAQWAAVLDLPGLTGPFVVAVIGCAVPAAALAVFMKVRPKALRIQDADCVPALSPLSAMWKLPTAQAGLVALAVAQTVMILIMAMTPLHIISSGHELGSVGFVISVHILGMFGLAPVAGRLADRFGRVRMVLVGFATLAAAALGAASFPVGAGPWLAFPLFLLGLGWSFAFVSGSALLTEGLAYADRARLQGATDSVVWTSAAVAGLGSGALVAAFSYAALCVVGALLLVGPAVVVVGRRRAIATVTA